MWSGLGQETHPRSSPAPREEGAEQLSRKVSRVPSPTPPPIGEGRLFRTWGQGMASERGVVLVPFPETRAQERGAGRQRVRVPRVAALGPLRRLLGVAGQREPCRVWDDMRRHLHSPSLLQVGGGGGVARRGSVFLAVTLIRCCVGTCTESGWAFTSPVRIHFLLEKLLFPPPPRSRRTAAVSRAELGEHVCSARGRQDRAGAGRPPGPGRENPALALRRAAECGAYARRASGGLVSICPFCLRVKFAGENPMIRVEPLGGEPTAPPPKPDSDRWKR